MDKNTLSQYGWVIICIIVIAILLGLATPFGNFVKDSVYNTTTSFGDKVAASLSAAGADINTGGFKESLSPKTQIFYTTAPSTLSFHSTAPLEGFREVQINGETLDPSNYTLKEGGTIVILSTDYLKTLNVSDYEITVVFDNGSPSANFSVVEPELNEYNFFYNQPYSADVDAFGGTVVFFLREDGTMDILVPKTGLSQTGTFTVSGDIITTVSSAGTIPVTIQADGYELGCPALGVTFVLNPSVAAADDDFIYYNDSTLDGYSATAIDTTKASYNPIRSDIDNVPVVAIGKTAFYTSINGKDFDSHITSVGPLFSGADVEIPDSVTIIGDFAFGYCKNLTSVIIPDSVTNIGKGSFQGCGGLTEFIIPERVTNIGEQAFYSCSSLTSITIPDSVTSIGVSAFKNCTSLEEVTIGNSVTSIGESAFNSCMSLTSITIPNSVTSIGDWAFYTQAIQSTIYCETQNVADKLIDGVNYLWAYTKVVVDASKFD